MIDLALPADDLDFVRKPTLDAGIFVEPKDGRHKSEFERQRAFLSYLRRYGPKVMTIGIPNGSRDTDWQALRKAAEGQLKGAPDLQCVWNHGSHWFEFKNGSGKPSDAQVIVLNALYRMGFKVAIVRTVETAVRLLIEAGAPVAVRA